MHQSLGFDLTTFAGLTWIENLAGGGVGVCIFTLIMSRTDPQVAGAHFTAGQVIYMLGKPTGDVAAGLVGDAAGYLPVMAGGGALAIGLGLLAPAAAARFGRRPESGGQ